MHKQLTHAVGQSARYARTLPLMRSVEAVEKPVDNFRTINFGDESHLKLFSQRFNGPNIHVRTHFFDHFSHDYKCVCFSTASLYAQESHKA